MTASRGDIRKAMRHRRRALSIRDQKRAGFQLANRLQRWDPWRRAQRIAVYLPNDGEIDLSILIRAAWRSGKRLYLPVLAPLGLRRLWFRRYTPHSLMTPNKFGIPEPAARGNPRLPPQRLDLVLAPLVAFDKNGYRLGMGAGFYDRTFAFLSRRTSWQHPRLIGVAHHFQQVPRLPSEPWDVPLSAIATDCGLICT